MSKSVDMSQFQPLYRGVWGPAELKPALAIALLWRMPERFRSDPVFAGSRRILEQFVRAGPVANSSALAIEHVRFDGEKVRLRKEAEALLSERGLVPQLIYFDTNYDCFIAFDRQEDAGRFDQLRPLLNRG